jgi:hypothetical protein
MSNDNTQDAAEPSPASAGSRPVAWSVGNPALVSSRTRAVSVHPQRKWAEASARHSGRSEDDILPLYLTPPPTLTAAERAAIGWALMECESMPTTRSREAADTLRALLKRLG